MQKYHDIRREYGDKGLNEQDVLADPMLQFKKWFEEAIHVEESDPTAMVLATVDERQCPDTRILLLKELATDGFIFYTNYQSAKAKQVLHNQCGAINFYWSKSARQVRVRGHIEKLSRDYAESYFASRPLGSQLSALASQQSCVLKNRLVLEKNIEKLQQQYEGKEVVCPEHWGGYKLVPFEVEFFQGRDSRLHDRLRYILREKKWILERLYP